MLFNTILQWLPERVERQAASRMWDSIHFNQFNGDLNAWNVEPRQWTSAFYAILQWLPERVERSGLVTNLGFDSFQQRRLERVEPLVCSI